MDILYSDHWYSNDQFSVAIISPYGWFLQDNLSRGNLGAIKVLQQMFPEPGRLQFIYADLGDARAVSWSIEYYFGKLIQCCWILAQMSWSFFLTEHKVNRIFAENAFDAVMHFAAVAYVGESTLEPLRSAIRSSISQRKIGTGFCFLV